MGVDRRHRAAARRDRAATRAVTYGDDGEKFGVWPHTKEWVWEQGLAARLPAHARRAAARRGRSRPSTSASTCARTGRRGASICRRRRTRRWASGRCRPTRRGTTTRCAQRAQGARRARARRAPFFRGGIWQSFLAKYPEANYLHKKMVWVSDKLARAEAEAGPTRATAATRHRSSTRGASSIARSATAATGTGCSAGSTSTICATRSIAISIEARGARRARARHGRQAARRSRRDIDADLQPEVILQNAEAAVYVKPDLGGGVFELDYRPQALQPAQRARAARRGLPRAPARGGAQEQRGGGGGPVSIHDLECGEVGRARGAARVRSPSAARRSSITSSPPARRSQALREQPLRRGRRLRRRALRGRRPERELGGGARAPAPARARRPGARSPSTRRSRSRARGSTAAYRISAEGAPAPLTFASESSLTLLAGDAPDRYYRVAGRELGKDERKLASAGELPAGTALELVDEWDKFFVRVSATPRRASCGAIRSRPRRSPKAASSAPTRRRWWCRSGATSPSATGSRSSARSRSRWCHLGGSGRFARMPELRKDPIVGRWVIIATERTKRPHDFGARPEPRRGLCPFCPGQEAMTPPELYALRPGDGPGARANAPGWRLRAFPNKFPALRVEGELDKRGRRHLRPDERRRRARGHRRDARAHQALLRSCRRRDIAGVLGAYRRSHARPSRDSASSTS